MDGEGAAAVAASWSAMLGEEAAHCGSGELRWAALRWRVHLSDLPKHDASFWVEQTRTQRRAYHHLCRKFLRSGDGRMKMHTDPLPKHPLQGAGGDPLQTSSHRSQQSEPDEEQIRLDVERLGDDDTNAPPISKEGREALLRVLRVWNHLNRSRYRQGMHELAAHLWRVRAQDALETDEKSPASRESKHPASLSRSALCELLQKAEVEADTFVLLNALLRRVEGCFSSVRPDAARLFRAVLNRCDAELAAHVDKLGIEWPPVILRWHRLLFLDAFPFGKAVRLWDDLLASESIVQLVHYVSVAMTLRIRERLLRADFSTAMFLLLHYQHTGASPKDLVSHANALRDDPTPQTGAEIRREIMHLAGGATSSHTHEDTPAERSRSSFSSWARSGANQLAALAQRVRAGQKEGEYGWSPRAAELVTSRGPRDPQHQNRRAMLSLDDEWADTAAVGSGYSEVATNGVRDSKILKNPVGGPVTESYSEGTGKSDEQTPSNAANGPMHTDKTTNFLPAASEGASSPSSDPLGAT